MLGHMIRGRGLRALVAGTAVVGLAACGGQAPDTGAGDTDDTAAADGPNVGIFVDNAFGDGDFFDQAAAAEAPLADDLGASVATYEGQLEAQNFRPLLQDAADANDLVFVLGFEAIDDMVTVAEQNPDTHFVFIDAVIDSPDITSAEFRTAEGCFMAGALAATSSRNAGSEKVGFIGGVNAPVIENCLAGYEQGVEHLAPEIQVDSQYAGSFVDPATGQEIAIRQAGAGAHAVFAYAGLTGAGAFDAASSGTDIAPIGVVADKSSLAPGAVPGSLIMAVDQVILDLTQQHIDGELERGAAVSYGFAEGGWDMVYDEELVPAEDLEALQQLQQELTDGTLEVSAEAAG